MRFFFLIFFLVFINLDVRADKSCDLDGLKKLLDGPALPSSSKEYKRLYQSAEENMMAKVDFKALKKIVTDLASGKVTKLPGTVVAKLKLDRAEGLKVRSSYRLFSDGHKPPKKFGAFVTNFGLLNDSLEAGDNLLRPRARELLKNLENKDWDVSRYSIKPAPKNDLHRYLSGMTKTIEASIGQPMHIEEFHDVRKRVRELRVLCKSVGESTGNTALSDLGNEVGVLSDDMGDFKDAYYSQGKDPHAKFMMPEEFKSRVHMLMERMKNLRSE